MTAYIGPGAGFTVLASIAVAIVAGVGLIIYLLLRRKH
jgi:hypothetical protein